MGRTADGERRPRWGACPPKGGMPGADIIEVGKTKQSWGVLSPSVLGVWVHYTGGRTRPCLAEGDRCTKDSCPHGTSEPFWQGWLAVEAGIADGEPKLLRLTPHAYNSCPALAAGSGQLRGQRIVVWRRTDNVRSRMYCFVGRPPGFRVFGGEVDLAAVLERLWKGRGRVGPAQLAPGECPGVEVPL